MKEKFIAYMKANPSTLYLDMVKRGGIELSIMVMETAWQALDDEVSDLPLEDIQREFVEAANEWRN